jgi:unsaturated chondroitin disaccharide hydrolase
MRYPFFTVIVGLLFLEQSVFAQIDVSRQLKYCASQIEKTLTLIPSKDNDIPRNIVPGTSNWRFVGYQDWCSGFWPGILWYGYEATKSPEMRSAAERFSLELQPLSEQKAFDHDLGFQIFNSFGNGYRLTNNERCKKIILATADTLATLFNPKVGTILSWPRSVPEMQWPQHNTIIDNMINLEMLFWASKNGGSKKLYDIAFAHANTTMKNHFRPDYTSYHAVIYDKETGKKIKGLTHQGYSDDSMWARGQSWAIYGFTMCYRETGNTDFLDFAQKVSDVYLAKLPSDGVPYWDFNDPAIPNAPRDASAAAVVASGLLELSTFVKDWEKSRHYRLAAENMLVSLSSPIYQSGNQNSAFLLHSTGHRPNGTEVDTPIIYTDYYYIEALLRLEKLQRGIKLNASL